ncbi:MAG: hypothetical protein C4562_03585 [Actinobacteria bacterium]|nr:MAG: hypothetical protein C4562_03585 [Actinomycetota bacterium]
MELIVKGHPVNEIETTICQIDGVEAARIVTESDDISEVHVVSSSPKNLKSLARDIESAVMVKHGLGVDYRKISIAQITSDEQANEPLPRPKLKSVNVETSGIHSTVNVILESGTKEYEGLCQGVASSSSKLRLVGQATINAVDKLGSLPGGISLEDVRLVSTGDRKIVTVCLNLLTIEKELNFSGSCIVLNNENQAVVKAVLAALNRKLEFSLGV